MTNSEARAIDVLKKFAERIGLEVVYLDMPICCGYVEDRDVHAAKNMLWIWKNVAEYLNKLPTEYREVTLMDWNNMFLGRNEKITL